MLAIKSAFTTHPPRLSFVRCHCASWRQSSVAAATAARKMAGPAPFCSWLVPGSVLISSYLDAEVTTIYHTNCYTHLSSVRCRIGYTHLSSVLGDTSKILHQSRSILSFSYIGSPPPRIILRALGLRGRGGTPRCSIWGAARRTP